MAAAAPNTTELPLPTREWKDLLRDSSHWWNCSAALRPTTPPGEWNTGAVGKELL